MWVQSMQFISRCYMLRKAHEHSTPAPVFLNIDISLVMEERLYSGFDPQLK